MPKYWLMKTEPDVFSFTDLVKAKDKTTHWEGVRNYQARNYMREFKKGDLAFIYHSNTESPAIMGIAKVVREAHPDNTALDPKSDYFDEKAKKKGQSPWVQVAVKAVSPFRTPVTRDMLKADKRLNNMRVLQKGSRLSIQPVTEQEFKIVEAMGNGVTS